MISVNAKTVVVASDQDSALAYQLSNHLNSSTIIIPWGSTNKKYLDDIKSLNPDKIIIIGGTAAVPDIYNYGNYTRYAGKNRMDTAYIILSRFYNINRSEDLIYYPSKNLILSKLHEKNHTWKIISGNSPVSKKWSKYVFYSLNADKDTSNKKSNNTILVYIGNVDNNPQMKSNWDMDLPCIVSFCPAIIYYNNTLYITGSDENLPIAIGRLFEKHYDYNFNDLLLFFAILLITFVIFYRYIKSPYYIIALIISILWIFWHKHSFGIVWDSLFVYLDGALSLLYMGHYETIINVRGFSGLSYILYIWFIIFKPSLESIIFYQIYIFFILIGTLFLYFKRKILALLILLILITSQLFTKYVLMFSTELTFITFLALILYFLKKLNNKLNSSKDEKNKYKYIDKYVLIISSITAIASLVRIHALIVPLLYLIFKRDKISTYCLLSSIVLYGLLLTITSGHILGYVSEVSTKGGITLNLIMDNILFYLPKFVKLSAIPLIIMAYEFWKKMEFNKFTMMIAIIFLIMPMLWVAQDERYLLPSIFLFTIACLEPLDHLNKNNISNKNK
jgi:hypothetical protein